MFGVSLAITSGISLCSVEPTLGCVEISIDISIKATETQCVSLHNSPVNACSYNVYQWHQPSLKASSDSSLKYI